MGQQLHDTERSASFRRHCRDAHGINVDGLDRRLLAEQHRADHSSAHYGDHEIIDVERTEGRMSTYVSIGRNVGSEPMSLERWVAFETATHNAVQRYAGPVVSVAYGDGEWEGSGEETAIIVGTADATYGLADELLELAKRYDQEAIAVTYGPTRFIGPER